MRYLILALCLLFASPLFAGGDEVVLRTGTLADFDRAGELVYDQGVALAQDQALADREVGQIVLAADPNDPDGVLLRFAKDDQTRHLGAFPQSVGNPLFMYFAETVIRDMAGIAGGSPFYIRNRIKDALVNRVAFSEAEAAYGGAQVPVTVAVMRPFENDPNRERMQGFADLTLTATMSEAVPGWYLALEASAAADGQVIYQRRIDKRP